MLHEVWTRKSMPLRIINEAYFATTAHLVYMGDTYPEVTSVCLKDLTDWRRELDRRVGGMP